MAERALEVKMQHRWRLGIELATKMQQASALRASRVSERKSRAAEHNKAVSAKALQRRAGAECRPQWPMQELACRTRDYLGNYKVDRPRRHLALAAGKAEVASLVREVVLARRAQRAREHNQAVVGKMLKMQAERRCPERRLSLAQVGAAEGEPVHMVASILDRAKRAARHNEAVAALRKAKAKEEAEAEEDRWRQEPRPASAIVPSPRAADSERALRASWSNRLKREAAQLALEERGRRQHLLARGLISRVEKALALRSALVSERAARVAAHNRAVVKKVVQHRESLRQRKEQLQARVIKKSARAVAPGENFEIGSFVTAWMDQLISQVLDQEQP